MLSSISIIIITDRADPKPQSPEDSTAFNQVAYKGELTAAQEP